MENLLNKTIGARIKEVRKEKGLKQVDLAKIVDGTSALISNIENGGQSIQLIDLYKIAEYLGREVASFLPTLQELQDSVPSVEKDKEGLPDDEKSFVEALRKYIVKEQ